MSVLRIRRRAQHAAPRRDRHPEITPAQAAAHADAFHGRAGTHPHDEPAAMTAGSAPWAAAPFTGAQDRSMEAPVEHHDDPRLVETQPWRVPEGLLSAPPVRSGVPRPYHPAPATGCLLPAIDLDREIALWVENLIAAGRLEDVDAYAERAERRAGWALDAAQRRVTATLSAVWYQVATALAAGEAA